MHRVCTGALMCLNIRSESVNQLAKTLAARMDRIRSNRRTHSATLLFKGDDFTKTDIAPTDAV